MLKNNLSQLHKINFTSIYTL